MKPDWDKLAADFDNSPSAVIADVDCTAGGKTLCNEIGVKGYPTIKWGDPNNLEDYKGGRTYDALKKFAEENLGPTCGPSNIDLCDADKKAEIEKFQAMPAADLDAAIVDAEEKLEAAEGEFKKFVEGLQSQYEAANKKKDDTIAEMKNSGLGMMKAVKAAGKGKEEL